MLSTNCHSSVKLSVIGHRLSFVMKNFHNWRTGVMIALGFIAPSINEFLVLLSHHRYSTFSAKRRQKEKQSPKNSCRKWPVDLRDCGNTALALYSGLQNDNFGRIVIVAPRANN